MINTIFIILFLVFAFVLACFAALYWAGNPRPMQWLLDRSTVIILILVVALITWAVIQGFLFEPFKRPYF